MFDEAVGRNDAFFAFYLQRGLAKQKLADEAGAQRDFERSLKLLPTATAHYALGNMALRNHDEKSAITHYRAAAGSRSPLGRQAAISLARLELPREPGKYISVRGGLDGRDRFLVQISNRAPIAVTRIVLGIQHRAGRMDKIPVESTIPAGKSLTLRLPKPRGEVRIGVVRATPVQPASTITR